MALPDVFDADRPAVVQNGDVLTFGVLDRRAKQIAQLMRRHGVEIGDHVAFCLENRLDFFSVIFASIYAGVHYTAISPYLHEDEIAYIVDNCGAKLVVGSDRTLPKMAQARAECQGVGAWYTLDAAVDGYDGLVSAMADQPVELPENPQEGVDMLYSSGSTGRPKGVLRSRPDCVFGDDPDNARPIFNLNGLDKDTVYLNPAPLYHAAPLRWTIGVLRRGGRVINMERFDAQACLELVTEHRVTHIQFVPTMMIRLLKLPEAVRAAADISSIRRIVHAAAPMPAEAKKQFIDWWGPIVDEYYGGTESNGLTYARCEDWLANPGTVGQAALGVIHIIGPDDQPLPPGQPGRVFFTGGMKFAYHKEPEKTAGAYLGEMSTLGDIGYVNDDGFLFLTDRDVNLIISGGTNIYPQLTEDTLVQHPGVTDAAAIGTPDADMGEVILAVVEPSDPALDRATLIDQLRSHCAEHLPTIRRPKHYEVVDAMPRHPNGKLRKVEMREHYRQARTPATTP
ncbi:MAG: AMP-binding protein [Pseudomonadota bacterium]